MCFPFLPREASSPARSLSLHPAASSAIKSAEQTTFTPARWYAFVMTFLLLFNPCLRVQLVASIVSGDQSPEQRPAEQTYFSLLVWISTFAIHCWVFQAPKGGPNLRRIAPRCCHFHVPWVWGRLCSGVADWKALFYILAQSCPGGLSRHFL